MIPAWLNKSGELDQNIFLESRNKKVDFSSLHISIIFLLHSRAKSGGFLYIHAFIKSATHWAAVQSITLCRFRPRTSVNIHVKH